MDRHLIVLPDGTEIYSGLGTTNAIQTISHTSTTNKGPELTPGSVCSDMLEAKLFTPNKNLSITVGTEVDYYSVSEDGTRTKIGIYRLETPERPSRNTYKFIAYDRVSWLDRDLTQWIKDLDGWPYDLLTFARMVCDACVLTLVNTSLPNGNFPVNEFKTSRCTGRDLMAWIGELCGKFCRATPDGKIEFSWYENTGMVLEPTGENFYSSGMKYEDYQVEPIEAVQVRIADNENGLLFPDVNNSRNRYVISGNPLVTFVNEDLLPYLDILEEQIGNAVYSPCKVSFPANPHIHAGDIIRVRDMDGYEIQMYVMTVVQKGNRMTIESVGSPRRDSATSLNNQDNYEAIVDAATKRMNQTAIFNKLTDNGTAKGFFLGEDGQIYINATYLSTGILQSVDGDTFYLDLESGILKMNATEFTVGGKGLADAALKDLSQEGIIKLLTDEGAAEGIVLVNGQLYFNASYINSGKINADLITAGILQSKDGETFKLDLEKGTFSMSGTGKFMSPDKKSYVTLSGNDFVLYSISGDASYGNFVPIARIGFTEDSEGVDYPYFLLGNETSTRNNLIGMLKMFDNGIYIGNSVPADAVGEFKGLPGASGMFVDMVNGKNYVVEGTKMFDSFTAVFG